MELEPKLKIHPFAMMEGTLKYSMKIRPEDAMMKIQPLIDEVRKVDGVFMSLWHNDTLNDRKIWLGWKTVYEQMVSYATLDE